MHSPYRPARQLWVRSRHGHYLPNPAMGLRAGDGWQPVYEAVNMAWIDRGCGGRQPWQSHPAAVVDRLAERTLGEGSEARATAEYF